MEQFLADSHTQLEKQVRMVMLTKKQSLDFLAVISGHPAFGGTQIKLKRTKLVV
jgi:hypothetical protein